MRNLLLFLSLFLFSSFQGLASGKGPQKRKASQIERTDLDPDLDSDIKDFIAQLPQNQRLSFETHIAELKIKIEKSSLKELDELIKLSKKKLREAIKKYNELDEVVAKSIQVGKKGRGGFISSAKQAKEEAPKKARKSATRIAKRKLKKKAAENLAREEAINALLKLFKYFRR